MEFILRESLRLSFEYSDSEFLSLLSSEYIRWLQIAILMAHNFCGYLTVMLSGVSAKLDFFLKNYQTKTITRDHRQFPSEEKFWSPESGLSLKLSENLLEPKTWSAALTRRTIPVLFRMVHSNALQRNLHDSPVRIGVPEFQTDSFTRSCWNG